MDQSDKWTFDNLKIFLVDDEDHLAWAIETELRGLGAQVKRASSLKQALERFPAFGADIAISDINFLMAVASSC